VPDSVETCYVSALYALYDDQAVASLNAHPHPCSKGLKTLIERLKIDWAAERGGRLRTVLLIASTKDTQ
jgi:hypothetical protein